MRTPLTMEQVREAAEILDADMRLLVKSMFPKGHAVPEAEVRTASVILRRWIAEGGLSDLAATTGAVVEIPTFDNAAAVASIKANPNIRSI
jgi:hypothetical protein